jgi:hypothetical protein
MESKNSVSGAGGKKQKSLMAFFAKQAQPTSVRPKSPPRSTSVHRASELKGSSPRSASSSVAGSGKDTPPTSDIHDVEKEADREEVSFTVPFSLSRVDVVFQKLNHVARPVINAKLSPRIQIQRSRSSLLREPTVQEHNRHRLPPRQPKVSHHIFPWNFFFPMSFTRT